MNLLSQIFAGATALALVTVFVLEAFFHHRRALYPIFLIRPEDVPAVRMWAVNVGFYNLCYAIGIIIGLVLLHSEWVEAGRALVLFGCASHVVLGVVLFASERRLWVSALGQSMVPLVAVVAYLIRG
ncbi:DUF1304 family protein [Kocuria sp. M1R5S2]|uniref:DUF1304 family protein n=1 Tax=Kocuria rhizosphaerae TaxID=3376285 RepID=UPI003799B060